MKNLKKIYISTYFKYVLTAFLLIASMLLFEACFLLPETVNDTNGNDIVLMTTATPIPSPVIVDIGIQGNNKDGVLQNKGNILLTPEPNGESFPDVTFMLEPEPETTPDNNNKTTEKEEQAKADTEFKPTAKPVPKQTAKPEPKATPKSEPKPTAKLGEDYIFVGNPTEENDERKDAVETINPVKTPEPEKENKEPVIRHIDYVSSGSYSAQDLELVARVASFEAGSTDGRKAVMNVIYNRCKSSKFGGKETSITTEVYRKSQFSVVKNESFEESTASNDLIKIADEIFNNGNAVLPNNVYYFRSAKKGTEWGDKVYYDTIGGNAFFAAE